jgi:hypothetical protein
VEVNTGNKLPAGVNPGDANTGKLDSKYYQMDWFPLFLQLQKMDKEFFEYILTEAENDRQ